MPRGERPLDAGDSPLLRFAAELRRLRQKAGNPTYRALSERAHYSIATLSSAAGGRVLPTLAVTLAYVRACDGDTQEWERIWHTVAAELAAELAAAAPPAGEGGTVQGEERPPYAGLAPFEADDADWFFGRERLVDELTARLAVRRFVAVFGASGSGKSSVLRAGLLPRLRAGQTTHTAVLFTPGSRPLHECASRLAELTGTPSGELAGAFAAEPLGLHHAVNRALARQPEGRDIGDIGGTGGTGDIRDIVLVVDQFEEIFTQCARPEERAAFISALLSGTAAPDSRCRVVIGVRADFYAHCLHHRDLCDALGGAQLSVGPMSAGELRSAILRPATRARLSVEGALLAALMTDVTGRAGTLPLLSHALLETWRRRRGNTLTLGAFQAAGGIEGALAQTAEEVYASFDVPQQAAARQIFLRLTALGDGTEDTKRRLVREELGSLDHDPADVATVLERAARARLVTLDRDRAEITHEALIRCWPRLRGWLTEDRDHLRLHRRLTEAAQQWQALGEDPGALYRGVRLSTARDLAAPHGSSPIELTSQERAFLDASLAAEAAETARARRASTRLRRLAVLLAALLLVAVAEAVYAVRAEDAMARQRNTALSREVADEAVALRHSRPALAAQLALAAYRLVPTEQARDGLLSTMTTSLTGHTQWLSSVALAPDARTLATGSFDRTVRLWELRDDRRPQALATVTGHTDTVTSVAFSPAGRLLATAGRDRAVRLWDVTDRRRPALIRTLTGHRDTVFSVVFSPDGRTLATGSYDHTVRLWDITDPTAGETGPTTLTDHTLNVKPVAFSPDGRTLASAGDDRTVRLWDVRDVRRPVRLSVLTGHEDFVDTVAFSPDGRTLASGSDDRTVRLWDVSAPRRPAVLSVLTGHADVVTSLSFSPDSRTLASASDDRTARLWDVTDPHHAGHRATFTGHVGAVNAVLVLPQGRGIVTASADHTAQIWQTDTRHAIRRACESARPPITRPEWSRYFPDIAYQPPC
ncbi:XRE family transcriptional regulator [Streptomyces aureoversilis]|uniref:XRE family transcriptional regulator n=1 Tax=Streptomyces aureoversilis TaxID=67277 RepID=A0ABV9ZTV4_9ACTN